MRGHLPQGPGCGLKNPLQLPGSFEGKCVILQVHFMLINYLTPGKTGGLEKYFLFILWLCHTPGYTWLIVECCRKPVEEYQSTGWTDKELSQIREGNIVLLRDWTDGVPSGPCLLFSL